MGNDLNANKLKQNKILTPKGAIGDATESDVLEGKIFSSEEAGVGATGTLLEGATVSDLDSGSFTMSDGDNFETDYTHLDEEKSIFVYSYRVKEVEAISILLEIGPGLKAERSLDYFRGDVDIEWFGVEFSNDDIHVQNFVIKSDWDESTQQQTIDSVNVNNTIINPLGSLCDTSDSPPSVFNTVKLVDSTTVEAERDHGYEDWKCSFQVVEFL